MNKKIIFFTIVSIVLFFSVKAQEESQFSFDSLIGDKLINLKDYKGKVILLVNTASKCGLTRQYKGLEEIYSEYKNKGLVVIAVPSNDFAGQEPWDNEEIAKFCNTNYGITFPITSKYSVKGEKAHPFYKYAISKLGKKSKPKWNFHKYLINKEGNLVAYFSSRVKPNSEELIKSIEEQLQK